VRLGTSRERYAALAALATDLSNPSSSIVFLPLRSFGAHAANHASAAFLASLYSQRSADQGGAVLDDSKSEPASRHLGGRSADALSIVLDAELELVLPQSKTNEHALRVCVPDAVRHGLLRNAKEMRRRRVRFDDDGARHVDSTVDAVRLR